MWPHRINKIRSKIEQKKVAYSAPISRVNKGRSWIGKHNAELHKQERRLTRADRGKKDPVAWAIRREFTGI